MSCRNRESYCSPGAGCRTPKSITPASPPNCHDSRQRPLELLRRSLLPTEPPRDPGHLRPLGPTRALLEHGHVPLCLRKVRH